MKYMKRSQQYQASNVSFNPSTLDAHSYGWWRFVARINGHVVFNQYRYSNTTVKHQSKVSSVMRELGIKVDLYVSIKSSLSENVFNEAANQMITTGNDHGYAKLCKVFEDRLSQDRISELVVEREENICETFLLNSIKRQERKEREEFLSKVKTLENHLENVVHFRDYDIVERAAFGDPENKYATKVAVHQVVDVESLERDVENALYNFQRDGFGCVVFYV